MPEIAGGCLCGAVRFVIEAEPVGASYCHCRDCQKASGGMPNPVVLFPRAAFRLTKGDWRTHRLASNSGVMVERHFCAECGSRIAATNPTVSAIVPICAGALDDPGWFKPKLRIWAGSAPAWHLIDPGLPALEAQ
jgi:hypothetical protein